MCQIKEKEALKKEEKVKVYYDDLKMIESRNYENEEERKLQTRQNELKLDYKKAITEQMQENAAEKRRLSSLKNDPNVFYEATGSSEVHKNNVTSSGSQKEFELLKKVENELKEIEIKESNNRNK